MENKKLINEISRMQELAGIISENKQMLNEDFLELKSIAKMLYSLIKSKGFNVELKENSSKAKYASDTLAKNKNNDNKGGSVEIHQLSDVEQIGVFVPYYAVVYNFITNPANRKYIESVVGKNNPDKLKYNIGLDEPQKYWTHIHTYMYGKGGQIADVLNSKNDPEIKKLISKLGQELTNAVKSKYPNMLFSFKDGETGYYMYFAEPKTAKGGIKNPNQRPNAPNPQKTQQQAAPQQQPPAQAAE